MSNHNDSRLNMPMLGETNAFRKPGTTRRLDRKADSRYIIQEIITDRYIYDAVGEGPYKGIVLRVEEPFTAQSYDHPEQHPEGYLMSGSVASSASNLLRLRVRIPTVHASLPIPKCLPEPGADPHEEDRIINLYPIFVAEKAGMDDPMPGQLVWVDFRDEHNFEKPIYKGLVDGAVTLLMPCEDIPQNNFNSARNCAGLACGPAGSAAFGAHCRKTSISAVSDEEAFYGEPQHGHNGIIVDEALQLPSITVPEDCRQPPTSLVETIESCLCVATTSPLSKAQERRIPSAWRSHKFYKNLLPNLPCTEGKVLKGYGIDEEGLRAAVEREMAFWHPRGVHGNIHRQECEPEAAERIRTYFLNLGNWTPETCSKKSGAQPWSAVYISYIMNVGGDPGSWGIGEKQSGPRCNQPSWNKASGKLDGPVVNCDENMMGHTSHLYYSFSAKRGSTDKGTNVYNENKSDKRNKYTNTRTGAVAGWTAWQTTNPTGKIKAQVGDILVRARTGGSSNTHGDVVWKISGDGIYGSRAWLSGGNVGSSGGGGTQTALATQYLDLDDSGYYKTFLSKQMGNPNYHKNPKFPDTYEVILKKNGFLSEDMSMLASRPEWGQQSEAETTATISRLDALLLETI